MQHISKNGKFSGQLIRKLVKHKMPGSSPVEREIYEHYLVEKLLKRGLILANKKMPMGGRLAKYNKEIDNVINKFNLPRFD